MGLWFLLMFMVLVSPLEVSGERLMIVSSEENFDQCPNPHREGNLAECSGTQGAPNVTMKLIFTEEVARVMIRLERWNSAPSYIIFPKKLWVTARKGEFVLLAIETRDSRSQVFRLRFKEQRTVSVGVCEDEGEGEEIPQQQSIWGNGIGTLARTVGEKKISLCNLAPL